MMKKKLQEIFFYEKRTYCGKLNNRLSVLREEKAILEKIAITLLEIALILKK